MDAVDTTTVAYIRYADLHAGRYAHDSGIFIHVGRVLLPWNISGPF
jgi:hypothetical protein